MAESAFANALVNEKDGFSTLLAVIAPNLAVKPHTISYNKVTIKGAEAGGADVWAGAGRRRQSRRRQRR